MQASNQLFLEDAVKNSINIRTTWALDSKTPALFKSSFSVRMDVVKYLLDPSSYFVHFLQVHQISQSTFSEQKHSLKSGYQVSSYWSSQDFSPELRQIAYARGLNSKSTFLTFPVLSVLTL